MADLPKPVSMLSGGVNRDYESIYNDLVSLIPYYTPEWTYRGDDDLGIVLTQLVAYLGDHLNYQADITMRDLRIASSLDRESIVNMANWLGYFPKRATPAVATVTVTMNSVQTSDVEIPAGTKFRAPVSGIDGNDDTNIVFESDDSVTIPAGSTTVDINVTQGVTLTLQSLGQAVGHPYEFFTLEDTAAIFSQQEGDMTVLVDTELAKFSEYPALAKSSELTYWVRENRQGFLEIRFGNGNFGRVLNAGQTVRVTYRSGGGESGLVAINAINTMADTITFGGTALGFSVANSQRSFGGSDPEDIESVRNLAPVHFRTQNRAVTLSDYKVKSLGLPGVHRANPVRTGINGVMIYVVPDNVTQTTELSQAFMASIVTYLDDFRMATDVVDVRQAALVPIDVVLECFAFPSQRNAAVRRRILDAFSGTEGILSSSNNDLGQHLRRSDMVNVVEDVEGLDYVNVLKYTRRPALYWKYRTGNAVLSEGGVTVTNDTVEEEYTITMLTPTTYSVRGSKTGQQTASRGGTGTLGVPYNVKSVTGNVMATFTIVAGTTAMASADCGYIRVSNIASNIQLGPDEFPVVGRIIVNVLGGIR